VRQDLVLDNPAWAALNGAHARFAEWSGHVVRYDPDVAPFLAVPPEPEDPEQVWADIVTLVGPGAVVVIPGTTSPPPGWAVVSRTPGVQLVDDGVAAAPFDEALELTAADVPEMLALVERTEPGPFRPRTIELGSYLGIRREGALIAMAGERLRPPGWTEISAVCTDAAFRGQGLGTRLVLAVAAGIRARGETPFMHAAGHNTGAIRLYESLGFRLRGAPGLHRVSGAGRRGAGWVAMTDDWHDSLRHVKAGDLTGDTNQTTGMTRLEAISGSTVGSRKVWMGQTHVAPHTNSGDHHHGEAETAIYVVSGRPSFVFADGADEVRIDTGPGDYVFVPPYVPHREENPTGEEAVVVIARSSQEGVVVNLPSLWTTVERPEE
jgi:uncharacterized RmlC-like cupin family protein/ribosomal protein S18 acetylase RimI-like enzyme